MAVEELSKIIASTRRSIVISPAKMSKMVSGSTSSGSGGGGDDGTAALLLEHTEDMFVASRTGNTASLHRTLQRESQDH